MYRQFPLVPIDPRQPLPQPPPYPFYMQQLHSGWQAADSISMPWNAFHGFYGWPMFAGPIYQGMAPQPQYPSQHYRAPSSGPHRNQRARFRQPRYPYQPEGIAQHQNYQDRNQRERFRLQAEPRYTNQIIHESFVGTVEGDSSTDFNPGHARIEASKNTGDGKRRRRKLGLNPSAYQIPTDFVGFRRDTMIGNPFPSSQSTPSTSTPDSESAKIAYAETTASGSANTQEEPVEVEDDDLDTISLGSD